MALDFFAGSFTRFYRDDWENVVQRQCRMDGTHYQKIRPGGSSNEVPSAEEVGEAARQWAEAMTCGLGANIQEPISWREDDEAPYFTDRPGWVGYGSLLLWAAYAEKNQVVPPTVRPEEWANDPVFTQAVSEVDTIHFRQILQAQVWLPCDFHFCFQVPNLVGEETMIGSLPGLIEQLTELSRKPLPESPPPTPPRGLFARFKKQQETPQVAQAAKLTLEMLLDLAKKGYQAKVPLMLSF